MKAARTWFRILLGSLVPITALAIFPPVDPASGEPAPRALKTVTSAQQAFASALGNHVMDPALQERLDLKITNLHRDAQGLAPLAPRAFPSSYTDIPTTGTVDMLTLVIDFADYRMADRHPDLTAANIQENLFGDGSAEAQSNSAPFESLKAYYYRASEGALTINGTVLGPYHLPHNRATYEPADTTSPDNQAIFDMVREALESYDATHDFSQYDNDGDGDIDAINIIYTGPTGAWATFWWGYRWSFYVSDAWDYRPDGVRLRAFTWQWVRTRNGGDDFDPIVVIHETGHILGLPDYYDYDSSVGAPGGIGGLDMMAANKGNHNGFSRWALGWISPVVIGADEGQTAIELIASGEISNPDNKPKAIAIFPNLLGDTVKAEFFLLENRQRVGNDAGRSWMPNDGFLVWHVDATVHPEGQNNNSYTANKLLRLVQADGLAEIEASRARADAGDYFDDNCTFTPHTNPNSNGYGNVVTDVHVSAFGVPATLSSVTLGFGAVVVPPLAPTNLVGSLSAGKVVLTWDDASADEDGFVIERTNGTPGSYLYLGETGPNVTTWEDSTVTPGDAYDYRVRAFRID